MPSPEPAAISPWLHAVAHVPAVPALLGLVRGSELLNGRFVIERAIGSGGMGVVYQAWDRHSKERVAVKTLARVSPASVYRLKLEFRAMADVRHPNLVGMDGLFEDRGRWCLVMELLQGETLARALERGMPVEHLRALFAQIACGLSAIHAAGRLHRDLKPANVMVTPHDRAVIMDFGLTSEQGIGVPGQTLVDGQVSGTPGYLSPEQAAGRLVTQQSDWYAFGVMLYESLAGELPAPSHTREMYTLKDPGRPNPPSRTISFPSDLERLCTALLEDRPERRASEAVVHRVLGANRPERESRARRSAAASPFAFEAELRELTQAYLMTDDDRAVVVWLLGPTGRGKTTLAKRFLEDVQLREEAVVLAGRCDPRESLPFRALDGIIDALSRHLRGMTINEARYLLPRRMDALCKLFPTLGRIQGLLPDRRRRAAPEDETASHALGVAALKELLRRLSVHRPLVLFIDDVQFGDVASAELLAEIFRPPDPPALLFVGGLRTGGDHAQSAAATAFAAPFARAPQLVSRELRLGRANDQRVSSKSP